MWLEQMEDKAKFISESTSLYVTSGKQKRRGQVLLKIIILECSLNAVIQNKEVWPCITWAPYLELITMNSIDSWEETGGWEHCSIKGSPKQLDGRDSQVPEVSSCHLFEERAAVNFLICVETEASEGKGIFCSLYKHLPCSSLPSG